MLILPDSQQGVLWGFTSAYFWTGSYLSLVDDYVYVSAVMTIEQRQGHFRNLICAILADNYGVKIPTPLGRMAEIVRVNHYRPTQEWFDKLGVPVEVWVLDPPKT